MRLLLYLPIKGLCGQKGLTSHVLYLFVMNRLHTC